MIVLLVVVWWLLTNVNPDIDRDSIAATEKAVLTNIKKKRKRSSNTPEEERLRKQVIMLA